MLCLNSHSILHHGKHPPWLGIYFGRSLHVVLRTPPPFDRKEVHQGEPAWGQFSIVNPGTLMVGSFADSSKLAITTPKKKKFANF